MKELQKSFKNLLSLETKARDLYLDILQQDIKDEEIVSKIRFIKNQEISHILMAKELLEIGVAAELRRGQVFSEKKLNFWKIEINFKRILLNEVIKLLDAKVHIFSLLDELGREAFELKKADKARQELIRTIVHHLKTPLIASNWISELFLRKKSQELSRNEKEMIGEIMASNKVMFSFIDDLLETGRIGEIKKIKKEKVDLVKIFKAAAGDLKGLFEKQKQKLNFRYPKDEIIIFTDEKSLQKIIFNLLTNSANYSKKGSLISIKIEKSAANKILFSISDRGIGIPKNEQNDIFKKFFRASNAKNIYQKGTGLGLYIVKELVKKLGGKIWFKSQENAGTTFYVLLPVK